MLNSSLSLAQACPVMMSIMPSIFKLVCYISLFTILHRLKDCGEDLLVDVSEVLFNELAFFRLMQNAKGYVNSRIHGRNV